MFPTMKDTGPPVWTAGEHRDSVKSRRARRVSEAIGLASLARSPIDKEVFIMRNSIQLVVFGTFLWTGPSFLAAANRHFTAEPDRISVIGHVPLSDGPVVRLTLGDHWRRNYLYVDNGSAKPVTVLDVTNAATPKSAGQLEIHSREADGSLSVVVGTAALVAAPAPAPGMQTVTIMSFVDPERPKIERQFDGVTATVQDLPRGLVYLADAAGVWVLHMEPATDVELQEQYRNYILYSH
jgi:hypothetical protein